MWRINNCPFDFPAADCPCEIETCAGAWSCNDLFLVSEDIWVALDTNDDGVIYETDNIDNTHLAII